MPNFGFSEMMKQEATLVQLSGRGQITLPAEVRKALSLRSGDAFQVRIEDGRIVLEPVEVTPVELYTEERVKEFAVRVFLDANALSSAALGGPSFDLVRELAERGKIELVTSRHCRLEAERNLARKRPERSERFLKLLIEVREVPDVKGHVGANSLLPEKDAPVYAAAVALGAHVLLTGDRKHFGALMARTDLPLRARTVRDFLLEGPQEVA